MKYFGTRLKHDIVIDRLYTVHYFEYKKGFEFTGERHDFWEFVYADRGNLTVTADDKKIVLRQGNIIFHKPNEWHNVSAPDGVPPNVAIVTFSCTSSSMKFFENKMLTVGQEQKMLISKIISEYLNSFDTPLNDFYTNKLARKKPKKIGSEQLIELYICELLLSFVRNDPATKQKSTVHARHEDILLDNVLAYMDEHISERLSVNQICSHVGMNNTTVEKIFSEHFGCGIIDYFIRMKIDLAKRYLRDENYTVTQIADMLGYSGVHYFSRQFKVVSGMTPTAYAASIKVLI